MTAHLTNRTLSTVRPDIRPASERLLAEGTRYFESPVVHVEPVGTLERVFSTLERLRIDTSASTRIVYVKRFRAARGEGDEQLRRRVVREYTQTRRAYEGLRPVDGLTAIRPLAVFPDLHVFVAEEARGETLQSLVKRGALRFARRRDIEDLAHVVGRTGRWLRAYQSLETHGAPMSLDDAREYVRVRMDRLCDRDRAVFHAGDHDRMLRAFDRWAAPLDSDDLAAVPLHADFNPENILIDGETVAVLDFSEAHLGLRLADVVHLYLHLERLKTRVRFSPSVIAVLQRQLLDGYGEPDMLATPLGRVLALQQAAAYLLLIANHCPPQVAWAGDSYLRLKRHQTLRMLERLSIL